MQEDISKSSQKKLERSPQQRTPLLHFSLSSWMLDLLSVYHGKNNIEDGVSLLTILKSLAWSVPSSKMYVLYEVTSFCLCSGDEGVIPMHVLVVLAL